MVSMIIIRSMTTINQMCFILPHLLHGVEFLEVSPMLFTSSFHKVHCYLIKEMGMMMEVVIYIRVSHFYTFFELSLVLLTTHAHGL